MHRKLNSQLPKLVLAPCDHCTQLSWGWDEIYSLQCVKITSLCTWRHRKLNSAFKVKVNRGDTEIVRDTEL